jgi:DNA-binding NtrC family response regulator
MSQNPATSCGLIGASPAIERVRALIGRVAPTSLPVLIEGPTGSGKELVASAIHRNSGRSGAFVPFNVCAIADTMFEDMLFGHVRGAFTGAFSEHAGYLAQANQGSAFFDEVSGLSSANQAKLLRAIETREFRPVGAARDRVSDFRVVAATNEKLDVLVARGSFRADLLHRFGKIVIKVPSLGDRREDVPLLAAHFLATAGGDRSLSRCALRLLEQYDWPGNVRELRSVVESATVLATGNVVAAEHVAPLLANRERQEVLLTFDVQRTLSVLREVEGNVEAAAASLGVNRSTVYRRLKRADGQLVP